MERTIPTDCFFKTGATHFVGVAFVTGKRVGYLVASLGG